MVQAGTESTPLRVAIVGSGPSGFYAADALQKQPGIVVHIDMFDRLPTPYGLVRGGVAPDHEKIKSVTALYDRIAAKPNFRFFGYVEIGKDISHAELKAHYHAVIYAVGAQTDRQLGIPGEELSGSHAATEFVGWYNAHPDYRDLKFDLSQERVAVIGNGNVAVDVVRILASSYEELAKTDIADYALEALANSNVKEIYMLGRRGPAQAAFTNPEIKELGELSESDIVVAPAEIALDPLSQDALVSHPDRVADKNIEIMTRYSQQTAFNKRKKIIMRFLVSPVELIGDGHLTAIKLVKNELQLAKDGSLRAHATDKTETLPVGLVFRSIGYKGLPLPGLPFDDRAGLIPNEKGRVIDPQTKQPVTGAYAVGWIKRGPSGIIGTNKPDSVETVQTLLADLPNLPAVESSPEAIEALVHERKPEYVTYEDWLTLDALERKNGEAVSRPRIKYSRIEDMLAAIRAGKKEAAR